MVVLLGYVAVLVLLFVGMCSRQSSHSFPDTEIAVVGQVSLFTDTGLCKIGLRAVASIPLLTYDL